MPSVRYYMHIDVFEIFNQLGDTFSGHPITISEQEVDLGLVWHFADCFVDWSVWLQRPREECIECMLTTIFEVVDLLQIVFPNLFLLFGQFQTVR